MDTHETTGTTETAESSPDSDSQARSQAVARIRTAAAALRALSVRTEIEALAPEPFVWSHEQRSRWWAFGPFGRYPVATPLRFGWPVGDYPWEGWVMSGEATYAREVFIRATFVDAEGRIAPRNADRVTPLDNHLLTAQMCVEIAARLESLTKVGTDVPRQHR
jgi:hypothetical protein